MIGGLLGGGGGGGGTLPEYGTWTPNTNSDATGALSLAEGHYTKIGRMVFATFSVTVSTTFTANYMGGLPFAPSAVFTTSVPFPSVVLDGNDTVQVCTPVAGTTTFRFYDDGGTSTQHIPSSVIAGYRATLIYFTA